jgi:hypothetical protein
VSTRGEKLIHSADQVIIFSFHLIVGVAVLPARAGSDSSKESASRRDFRFGVDGIEDGKQELGRKADDG